MFNFITKKMVGMIGEDNKNSLNTYIDNLKFTPTRICTTLNSFVKGTRQIKTGAILVGVSMIVIWPLIIPGVIINSVGWNNANDAFLTYYRNCVDLKVCEKYGIIVTPYNTSLSFK
jgi:hypothetical protein